MALPSPPPLPTSTLRCMATICGIGAAGLGWTQGASALGQSAWIASAALLALAALPQHLRSKRWSPLLGLALVLPWAIAALWDPTTCLRLVLFSIAGYLWAAMGLRLPKNTAQARGAKTLAIILGASTLLLLWLTLATMGAALSQLIWSAPTGQLQPNLLVFASITVFRHAQFYLNAAASADFCPDGSK